MCPLCAFLLLVLCWLVFACCSLRDSRVVVGVGVDVWSLPAQFGFAQQETVDHR